MNNLLNIISITVCVKRSENFEPSDKAGFKAFTAKVWENFPHIKKDVFGKNLKDEVISEESHQITFQMMGDFSPANLNSLISIHNDWESLIKTETKNIIAKYLTGISKVHISLGQMKFEEI